MSNLAPRFAFLLLVAGVASAAAPPIPCDHHVHVLSPALIADWKAVGARFSREDWAYSDPARFADAEGVERAFLISMAHLYVSADFRAAAERVPDPWAALQRENDFVAACVAAADRRFLGFVSIDPTDARAGAEIDRCRAQPGIVGVKLHLPACGVNLRNPQHVAGLRAVLRHCAAHDLAVLVHIAALDSGFAARDARTFWREAFAPAVSAAGRDLELICAHLGGAGGYNELSEAVFDEFLALRDADAAAVARVRFDLSAAILAEETDGVPATSAARCRALAEAMRRIGLERFLFASDYPVFRPQAVRATLREKLPLTTAELEQVLAQRSGKF